MELYDSDTNPSKMMQDRDHSPVSAMTPKTKRILIEQCEIQDTEEELKTNLVPVSSFVRESKLVKERGNVKNGRLLPKTKLTMPLYDVKSLI